MRLIYKRLCLNTSRLSLIALNKNYQYDYFELMNSIYGLSLEKCNKEFKGLIKRDGYIGVILKENGRLIGLISLDSTSYDIKLMVNKSYEGMGYMYEALRELERFLFLELKAPKLKASYNSDNIRCKRLFDKRGYSEAIDNNISLRELKREDYLLPLDHVKLYDYSFNPLARWIYRGEIVPKGSLRGVVDVIIYNTKYDKYLVTKRARIKDIHPGRWETTGGAIITSEDESTSARREVMEETGIVDISLKFLYNYRIDNVLYFEYLANTTCELDSIRLQEGETEDYMWLGKDEYLRMWKSTWVSPRQRIRLEKALEDLK